MRTVRLWAVAVAAAVTLAVGNAAPASSQAQAYSIDGVYVAGISSGAYMATQLHVAYSGKIRGAALFAGGAYYCAQGSVITAQLACMYAVQDDQVDKLEQTASTWSSQGSIDPIGNLSGDPAYVYHGTNDGTVKASVSAGLTEFYRHFGVNVLERTSEPAGHAWISPRGPNPCTSSYTPYINNCGTNPEATLLAHLLGPVNPPNTGAHTGSLVPVDQNAQAPGGRASAISMDATGYAYVPASCAGGASCRLVITLHGCKQGHATIGNQFMDDAYLNEYADTNQLVVLYPQAIVTNGSNPNGCWDWWGYTGANYAKRGAPQMATIMAMAAALGG
jgi:poly(3-hydroxybutyrate) depolymerase